MVDSVMTKLQQLGELADTLVIYTSDNGYLWGEHHLGGDYGLAAQKRYPYTESVRVPLFMRWDGHIQPGTSDARLTGTVDIVPTVLQAAGIRADYPLDGHSMLSSFTRTRILLEYWLDPGDASIPTWISVRTPSVQFVEYYDAFGAVTFREYYDLSNDPWELVNLLNDTNPANPDISQLVTWARGDASCAGTTETIRSPRTPVHDRHHPPVGAQCGICHVGQLGAVGSHDRTYAMMLRICWSDNDPPDSLDHAGITDPCTPCLMMSSIWSSVVLARNSCELSAGALTPSPFTP